VYRTVEPFPGGGSPAAAPASSAGLLMPSLEEVERFTAGVEPSLPSTSRATGSGLAVADADEAEVILDWKGDPMKINPGDKMPFSFGRAPPRTPKQ
jgi:hypothetical protein